MMLNPDNTEGWVDEMDELTKAEQLEVERSTRPVKLVLLKVSMDRIIPAGLTICLALYTWL